MAKALLPVQIFPLGDSAVTIQFGEGISPEIHARVKAFSDQLNKNPFPGLIELIPAYTTLTIFYNPWITSQQGKQSPYDEVVYFVQEQLSQLKLSTTTKTPARLIEIPVCYGGAFGPDLEFVATHNHLSPAEVVAIHASGTYLVYMIGFAPGFPYLGGLNKKIATPRLKTPRAVIPKGSVGIAGNQTGVYPLATPGGWQLIGRTPLNLFNPNLEPATLLQAGDLVRFVPITPAEYEARKERENEH